MSYTRGGRKDLRALELSESFVDDEDSHKRPDLSRAHRSSTITSLGGFDFRDGLLPLTLSGEGAEAQAAVHDDEKHVGVLHGMALVVGMQVGSGIFSSPGVVVAEVGSAGASLAVWVLSGVLAWTGASSFAELGCAIPISGGAQAYLAYSFGPMLSYLYTWSAVSSLKPGSSAIIALIFGEYVNRMIYHAISGDEESPVPEWSFKLTAVIAIILVSILNLVSRTMGTRFSVMITTVKIGSLIFVFILGLISLLRNGPGPSLTPSTLFEGTSSNPGSYALALYSGLWAFDGWDQCNFVAGEMHNPDRDLPRTIHSSMLLVLGLFLAANISYFVVLDPATVASSNTVALDFGRVTIGRFGAVVFSTLVAISCFGALSNGFYTTARLIYASARDHQLPELFTHLHHKRRTPDNAMALQAGFTIFFVIFGGGFRSLLNFFSVTSWTFYLLTVLGLLILRVKEPHLNRPYKAWIITPITFCIVAAFLLLMPIFAAPLEAFAAFVFMSAGVPMYYVTARSRARQASKSYTDDGGGVRAILEVAWAKLRDDIEHISPLRWRRAGYRPPGTARVERVFDEAEERAGMLRSDRLEMSER
ncbi:amino acid permease-domain-containing protein [Dioszegia hungarica]|uniref:Amino acid permease-domain-containing protein n=1 Tax=Dioszegia hungarica TaxID=4972 RepID=A0AA38HCI6_9TREE|nr:amino acid permease-domain-containing protein [Dioszegia hungarica]KAI9637910.1 amino acid permease-domain-containing protein [Dioszegia hungarica]